MSRNPLLNLCVWRDGKLEYLDCTIHFLLELSKIALASSFPKAAAPVPKPLGHQSPLRGDKWMSERNEAWAKYLLQPTAKILDNLLGVVQRMWWPAQLLVH